jgi:hypothetical protein
VNVEDVPLGVVMLQITRQTGKLIYFADPAIMTNERVTVTLHDLPWGDAVHIIARGRNQRK